jgi:transposase
MMGWQTGNQRHFYLFNLERRIPASHLLRRINPIVMQVLADLRERLAPFYSDIGRPSIDPELMIRMLIVGYCYGIRFERRLCEEVELHLAYRWFCRLDLDDKVPRSFDVLGQSPWAVSREQYFAPCVRGGGASVHERRSC